MIVTTRRGSALLILAACLMGAAGAVGAQELKVGFVDFARLLKESPQGRQMVRTLQDEFTPRERDINAQQQQLRAREEQLQRDVAVMGDTERRDAERDVQQLQRDLSRRWNEYREDVSLGQNEALGRLQQVLLQEVQSYARSANYDLIVSDGVLFASSGVDVTAQILAGLEASFQVQQEP